MRARALAFALALTVASAPLVASAQSPSEITLARQTAADGFGAYKAGEYQKALGLFEQARAVYPSAQILRMVGYSHLALEHWEKAVEAMDAALASKIGPLSADDRKDVEDQMQKALAHFGTVNVRTKVAGATVSIDGGAPQPLPLEKPVRLFEGKHKFTARAEGHLDVARDVDVLPAKATDLDLEPPKVASPEAPPPPPPPPAPPPEKKPWIPYQRTIGLAAMGTGVGLGLAGLFTTLASAHIRSNVNSDVAIHDKFYGQGCAMNDPRLCQFDTAVINNEADQADHLRNVSVGLFIGAGVLAAGGAVLYFLAPKPAATEAAPAPQQAARIGCTVAGAGLACAGSF